jgi:hypothetical protein
MEAASCGPHGLISPGNRNHDTGYNTVIQHHKHVKLIQELQDEGAEAIIASYHQVGNCFNPVLIINSHL